MRSYSIKTSKRWSLPVLRQSLQVSKRGEDISKISKKTQKSLFGECTGLHEK
jgi:hypothetical protein